MATRNRTVDERIAALARGSHGVVSRRRLLRAGISADQVKTRVARGSLIPVHRGVYRVGHVAPSLRAGYLAAVLACGDGAVLRGSAAAWLLGLIEGSAPIPEVWAPTERRVPGVRVRRSRVLGRSETIVREGIPMTGVPRTLVDLAATLPLDELVRACHRATTEFRTKPRDVRSLLERHPNPKGRRRLLEALEGEAPVTLSELERRFLARLRRHALPRPDEVNRFVGEHRIDCRWKARHVTVELDSFRFHNSRYSWQKDRDRERAAYARGDQHRRYTWADVDEDAAAMLGELSGLLL